MAHPFLSEAWMDDVEGLRDEAPEPAPAMKDLKINITVTDGPDGDVDVHLDGGHFERGHAEGAPTTLTVPHETARKLFVEGDQQAAMQAFMGGLIKVQGDMTKIMAMQSAGPPSDEQQAFQQKLRDITA